MCDLIWPVPLLNYTFFLATIFILNLVAIQKHRYYVRQIFRKICVYSTQSFQNFEASNLMWPEAHQCFLKRVFLCTFLKFDVQIFHYTLIIFRWIYLQNEQKTEYKKVVHIIMYSIIYIYNEHMFLLIGRISSDMHYA